MQKYYVGLLLILVIGVTDSQGMIPLQSQNLMTRRSLLESQLTSYNKTAKGTILEESLSILGGQVSWFNQSPLLDQIQGVASNRAYELFVSPPLESLEGKDIIVAVLDGGIDINHEDLQGKIWINKQEIPNNGIDDDNNGYIDDISGWNFIGNHKGMAKFELNSIYKNGFLFKPGKKEYQVKSDTLEVTRVYKDLLDRRKRGENFSPSELEYFLAIEQEVLVPLTESQKQLERYSKKLAQVQGVINIIKRAGISLDDWDTLEGDKFPSEEVKNAVTLYLEYFDQGYDIANLKDKVQELRVYTDYYYNINSNTRKDIVQDDNGRNYGNNDVMGPKSFHGTHVAGIIAANRDNTIGINGVAKHVKIMPIRVVPDGDERDKDVANAIIYAVDNGAQIINMSFGKGYSPNQNLVFDAIKYAQENNVLLVHAAGNESQNNDEIKVYPRKDFNNEEVNNWLEIGASYHLANSRLYPRFSNYGKESLDLFAPGVRIRSTAPNNEYKTASGTSMAAPVVSGVAAVLLSYQRDLDVTELIDYIVNGSNKLDSTMVSHPKLGQINFVKLSRFGAIPNLVNSLDLMAVKRKGATQGSKKPRGRRGFFRRIFGK